MNYKFLIAFILCLSLVSAQNLSIELKPHYFYESNEILVYDNQTNFDGLSFEVIGINHIKNARILSINIINASPPEFKNSLPNISSELRILQTKTLWISKIISTKDFKDNQEINFSIIVSGYNEKTSQEINATYTKSIYMRKSDEFFLYNLGKKISPRYPEVGLFILFFIIFGGGYLIWEYDITKRIEKYKRRRMANRLEKHKQEEINKRMVG